MLTPEVLRELRSRPVLLREVVAELGKDDAELASTAIETIGIEVTSDEQARALGQALSTLNQPRARARREPGPRARPAAPVVAGVEHLEKSGFDPDVVRKWLTTAMQSKETRAIGLALARSEPGTAVLRAFRNYFRAGVESTLRGL
jgi:hypothetical protein